MMMKTRMFIAKSFAKKHYKGAMDAMKSLKSKIKKPTGMKEKAMAAGSKIKLLLKKIKVAGSCWWWSCRKEVVAKITNQAGMVQKVN